MAQETEPKEPQKKPLPKRWITFIVVGLLIALLAIRIAIFVTAKPTITTNYAIEYNALTRPAAYDPNDNAAPLYAEAFELLSEMPPDIPRRARLRTDEVTEIERRFVEAWVAANREALERVAAATEKPYCWIEVPSLDWNEIGLQMSGFRQAGLALSYQARLLAAEGDIDRAMQSVLTIHRLARHVRGSGVISLQVLVATALGGIAQHDTFALLAEETIEPARLEAFQNDLEEILSEHRSLSLAGERIRLLNIVQEYFTDNGKGDGHLIVGKVFDDYRRANNLPNELADAVACLKHLVIAWRHPSREKTVQMLETLASCLDTLAQQAPWELHDAGTTYEDEIRRCVAGCYFLELSEIPKTLGRVIEIHHRARISGEALVVTIALLRYRQDKGYWPENLETLVSDGYIRRIPIDPFSGEALVYRPTGETFLLYSVGADFDDDGGVPSRWGQDAEGGDQVFWPQQED